MIVSALICICIILACAFIITLIKVLLMKKAAIEIFEEMEEKLKNDIYYVQNMSFFFDVKIIFMTIKCVLFSKNVYRDVTNKGEAVEREDDTDKAVK